MAKQHNLDDKDRQIISILVENPEASQSYIATKVNLSQPSVGSRIHRLKENGAIAFRVGMDFKKIGLHIGKADIAAKNVETVIKKLQECPYFLNAFIISGTHNLSLFLAGEDISTLEALVEHHVRRDPEVRDVTFDVVVSSSRDLVIPVQLSLDKEQGAPCGECKCGECASYEMGRCLGCPLTEYYKGTFWR